MLLVLKIILIILASVLGLAIIAIIIQPSLLTFPFSKIMTLFVKNPPYLDKEEYFPESKILEDNWEVIRDELMVVLESQVNIPRFHDVDKIQTYISNKDKIPWRTFVLKAYGKYVDSNCEIAPQTAEMIKKLPNVTTAMFSILDGGKHIPPHMGFYKGVIRYHLGLIVPTDAPCYIIVGGEKYSWKDGEGVMLDDTYTHEVWNKSENRRVVLFIDVFRSKGLPKFLQRWNQRIYSMLENSKRLEKALKRAEVPKDVKPQTA